MDKNIDGKTVSKILYKELNDYLLKQKDMPTIVDISIGDDYGGLMYSKMKQEKISKETGIGFESIHFDKITYEELINYIITLNNNKNINGIMLQLPLPDYLESREREILDTIKPEKDVDGLTTTSSGELAVGNDTFIPCTALGIEVLLKSYDIDLEGKNIAIINRSNIVGKPLALLMLKDNTTPTICHSKTNNLKDITNKADIIVAALNKKEFITGDYIKDGAIVIDVGVHKNNEGKTVGDVNFDDVYEKSSLITPPTGSVGPMTICMLAYNAAKSMYGSEINNILENGISKAKNLTNQK